MAKLTSLVAVFLALRAVQPKSLFSSSSEKTTKLTCDVLVVTFPLCPSLAVHKCSLRVLHRLYNHSLSCSNFSSERSPYLFDLGFFLQKRYAPFSPTGDFQVEETYWELPRYQVQTSGPTIDSSLKELYRSSNVLLLAVDG